MQISWEVRNANIYFQIEARIGLCIRYYVYYVLLLIPFDFVFQLWLIHCFLCLQLQINMPHLDWGMFGAVYYQPTKTLTQFIMLICSGSMKQSKMVGSDAFVAYYDANRWNISSACKI